MQDIKSVQTTNIIPTEAPELVNYVAQGIIRAIKSPDAEYTVKPGIEYFKEICGTQNGNKYMFKHIPCKKRGETAKIYASYGNLEFTCEFKMLSNQFFSIEEFINKKYVYDANTDSYVLRPNTPSSFSSIFAKWFSNTNQK